MLIWYAALDDSMGNEPGTRLWAEDGDVVGHTPQLHKFRVSLVPHTGKGMKHRCHNSQCGYIISTLKSVACIGYQT
jgi:hypothetical protein